MMADQGLVLPNGYLAQEALVNYLGGVAQCGIYVDTTTPDLWMQFQGFVAGPTVPLPNGLYGCTSPKPRTPAE